MVSLRKSEKMALLAAAGAHTHRRSARLVELEEKKRLEQAARAAAAATVPDTEQPPTTNTQMTRRKRGRKKKHVDEVTVLRSVFEEGQCSQWQAAGPSCAGSSSSYYVATRLPTKRTLESVLDVLQMMDSGSTLEMPQGFELETELDDNLCMPQDFGTVRAKLHEGYYTTFEHFENDIFSITSKAKHPDPPDPAMSKLAFAIERKATLILNALRTNPGFELYVLNWAASNRKTTGQLRIGSGSAEAAAAGPSLGQAATGDGGGAGPGDVNEPARGARRGRPCAAAGNRGLRRAATARAAAAARRCRRRTLGVSDAHSRRGRPPGDRPSSYTWRRHPAGYMYDMILQNPPQLDIQVGSGISYEDSLMKFARGGGAIAEKIARKVLDEQRAETMAKMGIRNQLPPSPGAAQWNFLVHNNSSNLTATAPHLSRPHSAGLPPAQASVLSLDKQQGEAAGRQPPVFYDLTLDEPEPSTLADGANPTPIGGFSFPPPSIVACSPGMPSFGISHSYWPTSDVGSSSAAAAAAAAAVGYNFYSDTANVPPGSTSVVGRDGSPYHRDSSAGEGCFSAASIFGPRKLNYAPLFTTASTSVAPVYYQPLAPVPAPQVDMSDFLQLGSCNRIAGSSLTQQLPAEAVDGFQYLLSMDVGPGGMVTSTDVSGAQLFPGGGKGKAPMEAPPEPKLQAPSQAVFDLKLLQSRLGENPWGSNGISALRAPWAYTAMHSQNPSFVEAGPTTSHNAEPSTLDLLGSRNPDLNLNL